MSEFLEYSLLGLLSGGVLALMGLSFVLIYKGTRVVNFAVGEIMMLGAYLYYTGHVVMKLRPPVAFAVALGLIALLSVLLERVVLRPLSGQPVISVLMATIGLSSIGHGLVEGAWGGDTYEVAPLLPRHPLAFGEVLVPGAVVGNFAVAAVLISAFVLFFRYSKTGIAMRATASDGVTAATLGIDIRHVQRLIWVLSGLVGTVAGVLVAATSGLSPFLSAAAMGSFAVIILGGLDSVVGAIVASLSIGWIEGLAVGYVGGKARDLLPYVVVLAILIVKPYGLFGTRNIERL
jgi:branched-chain amino acid transport system permease protein